MRISTIRSKLLASTSNGSAQYERKLSHLMMAYFDVKCGSRSCIESCANIS